MPTGIITRLFQIGWASLVIAAASIIASGGWVASRSEIVDEQVRRAAMLTAQGTPTSRTPGGIAAEYPVIRRIPLRGHIESPSGRAVPAAEMWWLHTLSFDRTAAMAAAAVGGGFLVASLAARWAWPGVVAGSPIRGRFFRFGLRTAAWLALPGAALVSCYFPLVSFWGTIVFERADQLGRQAWIVDSTATRAAVGAGLGGAYLALGFRAARGLLNPLLQRELGGVRDESGVGQPGERPTCLECGYDVTGGGPRCPECGADRVSPNRIVWIWPRGLGTPTRVKRLRVHVLLGVLLAALLAAPAVAGFARGLWIWAFS